MMLDPDALSHLKVKDLQRELKKRGLDTSGLKAALLERLKEHLQQEVKEDETLVDTEYKKEQDVESDNEEAQDKPKKVKRSADEVEKDEEGTEPDTKKTKLDKETEISTAQPESENAQPGDENDDKPTSADATNSEKEVDTGATEENDRTTVRIENFVRPFTLNAVKTLVQESGDYVEDGFWMDAIKTHCFVTYPSSEIAEKTKAALDGKVWPPENGRSLSAKLVDHTAMEVSQYGEANLPSRPKSKDSNGTQATQRQKVTIDEFFQKTETKPVLYYLPLTDEQVQERKQRQSQQPEGQPRKRRHRGGRKRNRRARFRR